LANTDQARQMFGDKVSWLDGKPLNHVTFDRLVEEGILPLAARVPKGARFFHEHDVLKVIKLMPKKRPPNKKGIVNYLLAVKAGK
jgi:hypothetical protein